MPDQTERWPDYEIDETLVFDDPEQYKALFDETRSQIIDLLGERAATNSELADALGRPKGTIGHHVSVLESAGLIRLVRTKMVRAIEAKYYGRTARTFVLAPVKGVEMAPDYFLREAAAEFPATKDIPHGERGLFTTLRHVRIPEDRADEWVDRLDKLALEFAGQQRGGETTYGMLLAIYPTTKPRLGDEE